MDNTQKWTIERRELINNKLMETRKYDFDAMNERWHNLINKELHGTIIESETQELEELTEKIESEVDRLYPMPDSFYKNLELYEKIYTEVEKLEKEIKLTLKNKQHTPEVNEERLIRYEKISKEIKDLKKEIEQYNS